MKKICLTALLFLLLYNTGHAQSKANGPKTASGAYLTPQFKTGEWYGTLFSRTIALSSHDFPAMVFRISGTGSYEVTGNDEQGPAFDAVFLYDGRPEDKSKIAFRDGGRTLVYNDKPAVNTDASGLTYNPLLWGVPPATLAKGTSWEVELQQPWELGGAGHQQVKVIDADPGSQTIRLKREGHGDGFFAGDQQELEIMKDGKRLRVKVLPEKSHWTGYTTFKNGIVISDELMVVRPLILQADSVKFSATQRQYILLNQMPRL